MSAAADISVLFSSILGISPFISSGFHRRSPPGWSFSTEIDVEPDGMVAVGGRVMRRAQLRSGDRLDWLVNYFEDAAALDLAVEHPEYGWTLVRERCLPTIERWLRALPTE